MSFNNNNNSPLEKNPFCKYGCQTPIKFDNSQVSARGIKIPLNLDGTAHNCPNSPYNKGKHGQQRDNNVARTTTCKYCNQQITFNDNIISARGRKIPLNIDGSNHNCSNNPLNKRSRNGSENKGPEFVN